MGLDAHGTKFLLFCQSLGVSFARTAMIGRQKMYVTPTELLSNFSKFGRSISVAETDELVNSNDGYAEAFLRTLGAETITSFDASMYENADRIHDFNMPIPREEHGQYSVVLDGGTLEHIFNYPTALKNCMEMVAVAGHFLSTTPANNQLGHGFYQFSPELFFRVFSEPNGFELERLMIFEVLPESPWYLIKDPASVRERVELVNKQPSMLLAIARKTREADIFASMPQQSDYVDVWEGADPHPKPPPLRFAWVPFRQVFRAPLLAFRRLRISFKRLNSPLRKRPDHFTKVEMPNERIPH